MWVKHPLFLMTLVVYYFFTDRDIIVRAFNVTPTIVSQRHTIFNGSPVRLSRIPQWILRGTSRVRPEPRSFIFLICQTNPIGSIIWNWCNKALLTFLNWNNFVIYSSRKKMCSAVKTVNNEKCLSKWVWLESLAIRFFLFLLLCRSYGLHKLTKLLC